MLYSADLKFDWHLTNRCNFDCEYCHPQIKSVLNILSLDEPSANLVIRRFDELGSRCSIHMSGGEPFLFPDYIDLCRGLTRHHLISINTNLSTPNISDFILSVSPDRVNFINAALHQAEREYRGYSVDTFVSRVIELQNSGFTTYVTYVLYPPMLRRVRTDLQMLRSSGIQNICAKVFKGVHCGKRYPDSYSEDERLLIKDISGAYPFNDNYLSGHMSFAGLSCSAGHTFFKINVDGSVQRCCSVRQSLGNFYNGTFSPSNTPRPCTIRRVLSVSQCLDNLLELPKEDFFPASVKKA